jgi:hypothetical protein
VPGKLFQIVRGDPLHSRIDPGSVGERFPLPQSREICQTISPISSSSCRRNPLQRRRARPAGGCTHVAVKFERLRSPTRDAA